jgi:FAD/FMN-containing dehydrogenase
MSKTTYDHKIKRLLNQFRTLQTTGQIGLNKKTSNLFRSRDQTKQKLDTSEFNTVISVDKKSNTITVEGMATFEDVVTASLHHGLIPLVVPELKTITVGGAVSGMAIESSSFKYGLMHESVLSMDVLTASGQVITCTPNGPHKDLFYGLPNSYGTLGYILKLTIRARPAKPYVRLQHLRFTDPAEYFATLDDVCTSGKYTGKSVDFVDGTVFTENEMYITLGFGTATAPYTSDYTYKHIFYQSIQQRDTDYLTIHDYLWRWDTDWFWCSKNVLADRGLLRWWLGPDQLGSRTYAKIVKFEQRYKLYERFQKITGQYRASEEVIQDIEVPIETAPKFLQEFQKNIPIRPIWVCPTRASAGKWLYPLYPMDPKKLYINFGFWDNVPAHGDPRDGYYNKFIERLVERLGGMKSLYSTSYYTRAKFEKLYNYPAFTALKQKYDPDGRFKGLYEKCVQRR